MFLFAALEMFAQGDDGLMDGCWWLERTYFRPSLRSPFESDSREESWNVGNLQFLKSIKKMILPIESIYSKIDRC